MASIHKRLTISGPRWYAYWRDQVGEQHGKCFQRRKDADAFLVEVQKEVKDGTFQKVQPTLMQDVFAAWVKDLETRVKLGEVRASTAATATCLLRVHLAPEVDDVEYAGGLGRYRSDRFTPTVMAEWRAGLAEKVDAGDMARKSFNNVFTLARQIFKWARHPARAYLAGDPLVGQKRLKVRKREAEFLEEDDMAVLLAATSEDCEVNALIHVMLFLGLRRGEAFGLKWHDVEAHQDHGARVHVRRSVYNRKVTETKTSSSERTVDAPASVIDALRRHRKANPPMHSDFVFRTSTGKPHDPNSWYRRVFGPLRERAGLREGITLHSLRHTFASLLLRQGEGLKYTSEQLGHSSVQITGDLYGHVMTSQRERAMSRLDETIRAAKRRRFAVVEGGAS